MYIDSYYLVYYGDDLLDTMNCTPAAVITWHRYSRFNYHFLTSVMVYVIFDTIVERFVLLLFLIIIRVTVLNVSTLYFNNGKSSPVSEIQRRRQEVWQNNLCEKWRQAATLWIKICSADSRFPVLCSGSEKSIQKYG